MSFRIAGRADADIGGGFPDIFNELIGILIISRQGESTLFGDVAPQGEDIFNMVGFQLAEHARHLLPGGGDTGEMGQRGRAATVL